MSEKEYNIIGVMSGTSLDGLDIVYCRFIFSDKWLYKILYSKHIPYSQFWINKLSTIENGTALEISKLNIEYGKYIGQSVQAFIKEYQLKPDAISSHGHTVFHQPDKGLTLQIGDGATIAAITDIKTICNFRTMDVALGGEGAPLVPVGDKFLFSEFDFCLNLGGIANISYKKNRTLMAFDICPCNMPVNYFMQKHAKPFDEDGQMGSFGIINKSLLQELNRLSYYKKLPPKSLGKEWVFNVFLPIFEKYNIKIEDKIRTIYEHIAFQINDEIKDSDTGNILISGGGSYNKFLVNLIRKSTKHKVTMPRKSVIEYKEALIFAFLGLLRILGQDNVLSSVTGAKKNHCSGIIYE